MGHMLIKSRDSLGLPAGGGEETLLCLFLLHPGSVSTALKHYSSPNAYNNVQYQRCQHELQSSLEILSRASPGTRGPCSGLESAIPISVIPYLSKRTWPVRLFHLSRTGTGRAEDPDTINLKAEGPVGVRHLGNRWGRRPAARPTPSQGSDGERLRPDAHNQGEAGSPSHLAAGIASGQSPETTQDSQAPLPQASLP